MTNSKSTNYGHVIMDVAVHLRGRTPIASAILKNGLNKMLHVLELQDGECVVINRVLNYPKCHVKNGILTNPGSSGFVSWSATKDTLRMITENSVKAGFEVIKSQRTDNLPLLQTPLVFDDQRKAA